METIVKYFLKARERQFGQSMTEYALIMAAVAVVAFAAYQTLGGNITNMVSKLSADL
jgi:Flp pilus assembly pilin Flp